MSVVAAEQYYPEGQRLVQDELALQFLPPGLKSLAKLTRWLPARAFMFNLSEKRARGVWGGVLCRKRYIDEKMREAVSAGLDALVILGAGLDTRAYRLAGGDAIPSFEVDLPENIEYKRAKLQRLYGSVPAHVTLVPIDFDNQDLASVLASQGYRTEYKSFFIWEAVTQYLTEEGIRKTFGFLARARAGSRLVFTYIRKDFIDGTTCYGLDILYRAYRVKRQLWLLGLDPQQVAAFLGEYGWKELEQVGSQEYTLRYIKPSGRAIPVKIERAVTPRRSQHVGWLKRLPLGRNTILDKL
jgi:methyltransferase (TIGR00027 family)